MIGKPQTPISKGLVTLFDSIVASYDKIAARTGEASAVIARPLRTSLSEGVKLAEELQRRNEARLELIELLREESQLRQIVVSEYGPKLMAELTAKKDKADAATEARRVEIAKKLQGMGFTEVVAADVAVLHPSAIAADEQSAIIAGDLDGASSYVNTANSRIEEIERIVDRELRQLAA